MQETPYIEMKNLYMQFDVGPEKKLQATHNVSLSLNPGDMVAVVGESGCGKSTLGKIALGIQQPTLGHVMINNQDIWDNEFKWNSDLRSSVQVVHQDSFSSLNPVKTVYQILSAPLLHHGIAKNKQMAMEKVLELLKSVDLTPEEFFVHKYPFQLSGGQRQRVSITRATILRPKVIIADEPVSAVDASSRLSILDLMKSLNVKYNIAFLYITHDLATARYFAPQGRLVVMYLGRIVETGHIEECIQNPTHPYLKALLKAIPPSDPNRAKEKVEIPLKSFDMPKATDPPSGCVFHPRCPFADHVCSKQVPELVKYNNKLVSCHHKEKINF